MKYGLIKIIFFVFFEVVFVKSECVTYSECLQQISDGFLRSFINFNTTDTRVEDIGVPGFENVNIESDDEESIFKTVASFLEELVDGFNSQFNVFHDVNNKTAILYKTVNISDDFEDFDNVDIKIENITDKNNFGELKKITNFEPNIDSTTTVNINVMTPKSLISTDTKLDNTQNPEFDIYELSKRIKENEIIETDSYNDINENSSDYSVIDYIDLYKDTTNEYVEIKPTTVSTYDTNEKITTSSYNSLVNVNTNNGGYPSLWGRKEPLFTKAGIETEEFSNTTDTAAVFPWVTAIFIKNKTSNQFNYYCDGALLSDTIILTAATCIQNAMSEDLLVILGMRSLKVMTDKEIIAKIKDVHIHENFTGTEQNLALLVMKVPVTLSDRVEPARLSDAGEESATTGWAISGDLTLIPFEVGKYDCNKDLPLNTFCSLYGNDVTVCPSYGGIYVTKKSNDWFLRGIRTDEPMNNSFCVDKTVAYTDLQSYSDWIHLYVK